MWPNEVSTADPRYGMRHALLIVLHQAGVNRINVPLASPSPHSSLLCTSLLGPGSHAGLYRTWRHRSVWGGAEAQSSRTRGMSRIPILHSRNHAGTCANMGPGKEVWGGVEPGAFPVFHASTLGSMPPYTSLLRPTLTHASCE